MFPLVTMDLADPWGDAVPAGELVTLRVVVTRGIDAAGAVELPAGGVTCRRAGVEVTTDLFTEAVTLRPGDAVALAVGVRFPAPGDYDLADFGLQVNPVGGADRDRDVVPLPARPVRVTPSLARSVAVEVARVCGYDGAVKVAVTVRNTSAADLTDFELTVGPADAVRAGPVRRGRGRLAAGAVDQFDLVVATHAVEFDITATAGGAGFGGRLVRPVPAADGPADGPRAYSFLEPRALTTDRVTLTPEGGGPGVGAGTGVFPVRGGKSKYVLTIDPSHPQASAVRVYTAAGQVEVERRSEAGRTWSFLLTVVDSPTLTQLVRLDYDVQVPAGPLRGELYLSVRPLNIKLWTLAATAGLALTIKGVTAVGPALLQADPSAEGLAEYVTGLFDRRPFDFVQAVSIPAFRAVLWAADRVQRPFVEG